MGESVTLEFKSSMSNPIKPPKELAVFEEELKEYQNKLKNTELKDEREALKLNITKLENNIHNLKTLKELPIEVEVLKTIVAFMNSRGGILLVGVEDNGNVSGIEIDYELFSDADGWIQHLKSLIMVHFTNKVMMNVQVKLNQYCGKTVAIIQVHKSLKPVYMEYTIRNLKKTNLFIRALNTTEPLDPKDYLDYFRQNWKD